MERRHEDLLTARIEEVIDKGWAFLWWWEAYRWYDQERLATNFWRDLKSRFDEETRKERSYELFILESDQGVLLTRTASRSIKTRIES
jgi:hypothetical protein